jgi:hypothetical protein
MMKKVVVLFLSTFLVNAMAETYIAGSTEVEVGTTILDTNNSTRKCVTYLTNPPEKYETACFTSFYTDGGNFQGCIIQLDNNGEKRCDKCAACTDINEEAGFVIDCDSFLPSISNYNDQVSCTIINDANIQALLTDGTTFDSIPFDFMLDTTNLVTDDSDKENSTKTNTKNATSDGTYATLALGGFITAVSCALLL